MTMRVVYRSYGGENAKGRPHWYSKSLALHSLVRAAENAGCEIVFLNNGPIPDHLVAVMRGAGEIVDLPGVPMKASFHAALRLPQQRGWADEDVVYFCEDDYLHLPHALVQLQAATERVHADYYALYGNHRMLDGEHAGEWAWGRRTPYPGRIEPRGWRPVGPLEIDGHRWIRFTGTTATFAARVRAVREDLGVFRQAGVPHRRMFRDRDIGLVNQGYRPYSWRRLAEDVVFVGGGGPVQAVRRAGLAPFKVAMNLRALLRRPGRRRLLLGAAPNLAAHMEDGVLPLGQDWERVAADTAAWTAQRAAAPVDLPVARAPREALRGVPAPRTARTGADVEVRRPA
jgi:hypothetical protein